MSSPHFQQLEKLIALNGSLPEKQLIKRWRTEIDAFLSAATPYLLRQSAFLELGIEDSLALKLNIKTSSPGAIASLQHLMTTANHLDAWGKYIIQNNLRYHCGIKLTPERLSRELYVYLKKTAPLPEFLNDNKIIHAIETVNPKFIGIDDHRGYSLYFDALDTQWVDILQTELGLSHWGSKILWPWQQTRFDGENLIPGKTALELKPLPLDTLTRFISHYPFPYFRYLIPMKNHRNGNFGRDPVSGRFSLYATVT